MTLNTDILRKVILHVSFYS